MITLDDALLAVQSTDLQPAIQCIFKDKNGSNIADYSFNPLVTTNRLASVEHHEDQYNGWAIINLSNYDLAVPDLRGCYVDLGYGANTASGLKYGVHPRLWVKEQINLSGDTKMPFKGDLRSILHLEDVWAVLNEQRIELGTAPLYQDDLGLLVGKTIYGIFEYLIGGNTTPKTGLSLATGYTFTLDALGTQDDGIINTYVPFPTLDLENPHINPGATESYDSYARFFSDVLLLLTKCKLRVEPLGVFKLVYPQESDLVDKTYYSNQKHYFYENTDATRVLGGFTDEGKLLPNHVQVAASSDGEKHDITGNAYSSEDYPSPPTYSGRYMPVTLTFPGMEIRNQTDADNRAAVYLNKRQVETFGGRTVVPHDAAIELYDNVAVVDTRGT